MIDVLQVVQTSDMDKFVKVEAPSENFEAILPPGTYDIGIDQSTSCTGIGFIPVGGNFSLFFEYKNTYHDEYYIPKLLRFINSLISNGVKIRYAVTEDAMNYMTGLRKKLLVDLHDDIMKTLRSNSDIQKVDTINVVAWRHGLMPNAKEASGDRRRKETVMNAVFKVYPKLQGCQFYCNSDIDGIEALGIILGYRARHGITDEDRVLKNVGKKNTMKKGIAFFKYLTPKAIKEEKETFDVLSQVIGSSIVQKEYSKEDTIYDNIKMCLVDTLSLTYITNDVSVYALLTHMKKHPEDGHIILSIVLPLSLAKDAVIQFMFDNGYYPVIYD